MTYSEFRYLWNVREVEKDNVARLRDITNIMTVTKVSVIFFLKEKMLQFAGIEEDTAEEEAMRIVCVLSDESRGKIVRAWQKREGKL